MIFPRRMGVLGRKTNQNLGDRPGVPLTHTLFGRTLLRRSLIANSIIIAGALAGLTVLLVMILQRPFEREMELRASNLSEFFSAQSESALWNGDREELARLARNAIAARDVVYVRVTDRNGTAAEVARDGMPLTSIPAIDADSAEHKAIRVFRPAGGAFPVIEALRPVPGANGSEKSSGTVQLGVSTPDSDAHWAAATRDAMAVIGGVLLLVALLQFLHLRRFLRPLQRLVLFTKRLESDDLEPLAHIERDDEIGELAAAFNRMVQRQREYRERVETHTRELHDQVDAKERARAELADAQQHLIELSRQSGMAEIATGVLHNVGNVLNSINVSASIVAEKVAGLRVDRLAAVLEMLQDHRSDLIEYLAADSKGTRVLPYLTKLGEHLQWERSAVLREIELMRDHVAHVKEIVATQQNYAKVSGVIEELSLAALVNDALRIVEAGIERHGIRIEKAFEEVPRIPSDKHKIVQILLNLFRNAKQAIKESKSVRRVIRVAVRADGPDSVRIEVSDTGIGLPRENLRRIFAHGFTTRADGHGFGLHSSALAAKDLGGSLWAESDGPGAGSTFILKLPFNFAERAAKRSVA